MGYDSEIQIDLESVDDNIHRLPPEKFNMHLVQMISDYWNSRGHAIRVWSEVMGKGSKYHVYTIKSDTVNGKPSPGRKLEGNKQKTAIVSPPLI